MTQPISVVGIYAAIALADFDAGIAWYTKLMGREPDDRPMPGMVQWRNMRGAGLQLWADAERAGKSLGTVVVTDLVAERDRMAAAGLRFSMDISGGEFGKVAQITDAEGNLISLAEPPKGFADS